MRDESDAKNTKHNLQQHAKEHSLHKQNIRKNPCHSTDHSGGFFFVYSLPFCPPLSPPSLCLLFPALNTPSPLNAAFFLRLLTLPLCQIHSRIRLCPTRAHDMADSCHTVPEWRAFLDIVSRLLGEQEQEKVLESMRRAVREWEQPDAVKRLLNSVRYVWFTLALHKSYCELVLCAVSTPVSLSAHALSSFPHSFCITSLTCFASLHLCLHCISFHLPLFPPCILPPRTSLDHISFCLHPPLTLLFLCVCGLSASLSPLSLLSPIAAPLSTLCSTLYAPKRSSKCATPPSACPAPSASLPPPPLTPQ